MTETHFFESNRLYTAREVSKILNHAISETTLRRLASDGKIPCCSMDDSTDKVYRLFLGSDLNRYFSTKYLGD